MTMKIRIHYNKRNAKLGLPWTVHTSKACFSASHIHIGTLVESEEQPDKKTNPRYFMVCNGQLKFKGTVAYIT